MELPQQVTIVEVGPRDGLQNEPFFMETGLKINLINRLIKSGFKRIEATSFVSPEWVPQLRDAEAVIRGIDKGPDVRIGALVPNCRGYERARSCGVDEINIVLSASESHNLKNVNHTIKESLGGIRLITTAARRDGIPVRGSVATAFGCPYEGKVQPRRVFEIARALWHMGCYEIVLADTVGAANPAQVYEIFTGLGKELPGMKMAAHFHDTKGMGLANVLAALQAGITVFDSSIGGMGGCPYAPGAPGNVASENLVYMLSEMNIATGIDAGIILDCVNMLSGIAGTEVPGRVRAVWNKKV